MSALPIEEMMPTNRQVRINFMTTPEQHQWLLEAKFRDHLSTSMRLRALIELVKEDDELAQRVSERASEIARSNTTQ